MEDIGKTGMWNLRGGRRRTVRKAIRNEQRKKMGRELNKSQLLFYDGEIGSITSDNVKREW